MRLDRNVDPSDFHRSIIAQKEFDKRAFLEFKNHVDQAFEEQEEQDKLSTSPSFMIVRNRNNFDTGDRLMLFTPEGRLIKGFKDIEGIYDITKSNLGFLVASWTGYFTGMEGYDPSHGHYFKKSIKERQVRENIERLEAEWEYKRNEYSSSKPNCEQNYKSVDDKGSNKTLYIWRNESYRQRFQPRLGKHTTSYYYQTFEFESYIQDINVNLSHIGDMRPPHMHDTTIDDSPSPRKQSSPRKKLFSMERQSVDPQNPKNSPAVADNSKSHAMMVQASAKDILSFDNVCMLSEKYKFDNKLIYELHSEFISIRDMQKSLYKLDNIGIPAKLFVKYCTTLKDKTPLVQKRFLRAFGIDFDKAKRGGKKNEEEKLALAQKLQSIKDNSNNTDIAPDTFVSWQKYLHLNALMKYQKGSESMFIDMWTIFMDPFNRGTAKVSELRDLFEQLARGRYTAQPTLISQGFTNAIMYALETC